MSIRSQYRASLKRPESEEILDLLLYRPVAFVIARVLAHTSVTPNQVTVAAVVSSVVGGAALASGTPRGFAFGALMYLLSNLLDCADGMLARIKGNGTTLGRMIDVFADVLAATSVYVGLAIGLANAGVPLPLPAWSLIVLGGFSYAMQAAAFDRVRNRYLSRVAIAGDSIDDEIRDVSVVVANARSGASRRLIQALGVLYINYMRRQRVDVGAKQTSIRTDRRMLRLWSFVGSTTHVTVFALAIIAGAPILLFAYSIIVANIWVLTLMVINRINNRTSPRRVRASGNEVVAVILAAGVGSRLSPLTDDRPKPLVEVHGRPMLAWTLDALIANDVRRFVVVVGHRSSRIEQFVDEQYGDVDIELIYNCDYSESNNAASLAFAARSVGASPMLLLDGDLYFDPTILLDVLASRRTSVVVRRSQELGAEEVKVSVDDFENVLRIGKHLDVDDCIGESVGIAYFESEDAERLFATLRTRLALPRGGDEFYEASFQQMVESRVAIGIVDALGRTCIEIDTIHDLLLAERIGTYVFEHSHARS